MKRYLYDIVDRSPWPLFSSFAVFFLTSGFVIHMHRVEDEFYVFFFGFVLILLNKITTFIGKGVDNLALFNVFTYHLYKNWDYNKKVYYNIRAMKSIIETK